ncbi:hypothetical protein F5883DRAFT_161062 [Diaporthe sp. PMI_573]|jgi:hypothetical protein|nr:hypothetical protein F5883DRAFT_161062 [Diaporthaceae sp. PMI_573]
MALSTAPSTKLVPRDALTDAFRVMPPLALTLCILNVIPAWIVLHAGIRSVLGWWYMLLFCCIIAAGEWTYFTDQTRADPSVLSNLATILLPAMASCLLREA